MRDGPRYWELIGQTAVPMDPQPDAFTPEGVEALLRWADSLGEDRRVFFDQIAPGHELSTVFLGLDHGWFSPVPLLFETAYFTPGGVEICGRWSTWSEAEAEHRKLAAKFREIYADSAVT